LEAENHDQEGTENRGDLERISGSNG